MTPPLALAASHGNPSSSASFSPRGTVVGGVCTAVQMLLRPQPVSNSICTGSVPTTTSTIYLEGEE